MYLRSFLEAVTLLWRHYNVENVIFLEKILSMKVSAFPIHEPINFIAEAVFELFLVIFLKKKKEKISDQFSWFLNYFAVQNIGTEV